MRVAVLRHFGKPLEIGTRKVPVPGAGEVLVRTVACGICRTDLHISDGLGYRPKLPHILGHEPAGQVEAIGSGVTGIAIGSRVATYLFDSCDTCEACHAGDTAQCEEVLGILGINRDGGFAEYFVAPAKNLVPVPDGMDISIAGLVSCAAVTAVRALARANLRPWQRVAVIGAGGVGILIIQLLVAQGHGVDAFDRSPQGRHASLDAGAKATFDPSESHPPASYDRIFDLVGTQATTGLASRLLRRQGRLVIVGEEPGNLGIDTITIAQREIEIVGTRNGGRVDAWRAMDLLAAGTLRPAIGARFPLDRINEAFALMRGNQVHGRVLVEFPT